MKKLLAIVLALTLSLSLVACGAKDTPSTSTANDTSTATSTDKKSYTIGFIPMTLNNEYFITMVNGAKLKAAEMGIELNVQAGDQHANAAEQLTIVENMITSGVDAICIVPSSSEGLLAALKKCKEANVPVINIDTKLDQSILDEVGLKVPFYGTDNFEGAKAAGEYVKTKFEKGTKTAILTGIEGQQNAADRRNGFVEGAGDAITVVAEQSANWEVDQGYAAAQNIITANPDLQLIYCGNDGMAIGALRAVQEAKLNDQIKIIGFDGISEAMNLIESGELYGSVAQFPGEMGMLGVENAVKALNGEEIEQYINTGAKLITPEIVKEHKDYLKQFE
ncbi:MAG: sugar ABC transporter substrate-binding protein [Oscillospiraceae bacterium]